jgi:hypothetical protein
MKIYIKNIYKKYNDWHTGVSHYYL